MICGSAKGSQSIMQSAGCSLSFYDWHVCLGRCCLDLCVQLSTMLCCPGAVCLSLCSSDMSYAFTVYRLMGGQEAAPRSGCVTCWAVWGEGAMHKLSGMRSSTSCTATT